jgi:hypothetical protein
MAINNTFLTPMSPIQRTTPVQRVANFEKQSNSIYNKFSYYDEQGGDIGFSQPFVYTKITDSTFSKNLTRYDSYTFPIGSTVRDLQRVGKFMGSGTGLLFIGKQFLLQNENAFNETRVYNPLSILKATAKPGSLGAIDYPQRHVETSGGILNFFATAILDTIGVKNKALDQVRIDGTATGDTYGGVSAPAYSKYAAVKGNAKYGLMRFQTANAAKTKFDIIWSDNASTQSTSGGFLSNLGSALVSRLASMIPSTNPFRGGNTSSQLEWKFRVEYPTGKAGIYHSLINTKSGLLDETSKPHVLFYNDAATNNTTGITSVTEFHRYEPAEGTSQNKDWWYTNGNKLLNETVGVPTYEDGTIGDGNGPNRNNLKDLHDRMVSAITDYKKDVVPQSAKSLERYISTSGSYVDIPGIGVGNSNSGKDKYYSNMLKAAITVDASGDGEDNMLFAQASGSGNHDFYNSLSPLSSGSRNFNEEIYMPDRQSIDVIFFYFYDLVNNVHIPFRATIHGLNEQHSADWEEIKYMGRADKLFIYKGFSRVVNINFKVYANSIYELVPMWERLNYLVGLVRPSKYTDRALVTDRETVEANEYFKSIDREDLSYASTGRESRFIYPPMVTFRVGDLFVDQPAVIGSVNISIPDEVNWESYRGDSYKYLHGVNKMITRDDVKSRQLPLQADVSMDLRLLEKKQALVSNPHYGIGDPDTGEHWKL